MNRLGGKDGSVEQVIAKIKKFINAEMELLCIVVIQGQKPSLL